VFRQEVKIGSALGKLLMRTARMLQRIAGHKAIPDIQKAAEVDVRPNIRGDFEVKFKPEVLPLKDGLGGMRTLFSHNVEFALRRSRKANTRASKPSFTCCPRFRP